MIKLTLTAFGLFAVATLYGAESRERYYPHCTPIITEIDRAWHNREIRQDVAHTLIRRCLEAEDRGVFN